MSTKENVILFAHKCNKDYVNEINISESLINAKTNSASAEFIVILDISGSMGYNVNRIITKILPNMLTKLNYQDDDIIHLITFDSWVEYHPMTKKQLENSTIKDRGGTYMSEVFDELSKIILTKQTCFRILTISDGDVFDQTETLQKGSEFAAKIKGKYSINSQAVRFFTSSWQPDTTALSSVLQLSTVGKPTLIDIDSNQDDNKIVDILYPLFIDDLDSNIKLQSKTNNLRIDPWAVPVKEIKLNPGRNVIWSSVPDGLELLIGKKDVHPVKVEKAAEVSKDNYKEILGEKIDCYIQKLKVLKVVGTEQAKKEMDDIIGYFHSIEPVSAKMEQIRNENNIDHLDNKQKAEYLRKVDDITKTSGEEKPTVVIPVIQCDPDKIKKEIDAKITDAKEKIAVLLKNKEHMIEEKKKEMIREINSIYNDDADDGIDIFCANYFNKALIEKMRQELDIDLLEGVPLKDSSANEELRDTECSFCKKNNNDKMYKNDIDQNYICNNCYEVLKEYYPADYIKLHNKIE